jgi:hypothetical protein
VAERAIDSIEVFSDAPSLVILTDVSALVRGIRPVGRVCVRSLREVYISAKLSNHDILLSLPLFYIHRVCVQHHLALEEFLVTATSRGSDVGVRQVNLCSQNCIGLIVTQNIEAAKCVGL